MAVRILIADDNTSLRKALRDALSEKPGWEVCGAATDGLQAVDLTASLNPDLIILDLTMPKMNGFQAARTIRTAAPKLPILLLTQHKLDEQVEREARKVGFGGGVTKGSNETLFSAIESLLQGKTFFERAVTKTLHQANEQLASNAELPTRGNTREKDS